MNKKKKHYSCVLKMETLDAILLSFSNDWNFIIFTLNFPGPAGEYCADGQLAIWYIQGMV